MVQFTCIKKKRLPVNSGSTRQRVEDVNRLYANLGEQDLVSCFFSISIIKKKKKIFPLYYNTLLETTQQL
jgi:hypothetical protein